MSIDEKKKLLAPHRLQQAAESLEEAQYLFAGGKSLRSVVNRIYYGMFYAVLALLIYEPYASSKHSGLLAYFNKHFVKGGLFSESLGRTLNKAFELRHRWVKSTLDSCLFLSSIPPHAFQAYRPCLTRFHSVGSKNDLRILNLARPIKLALSECERPYVPLRYRL